MKKDFFDIEENVNEYIKMCQDYDHHFFVGELEKHVNPGDRLLELGSGPGNDLEPLLMKYDVTASDRSEIFVEGLKERFKELKVELLDAVTININQTYDCIFSNKVLQHLSGQDMVKSLQKQYDLLEEGGLIFHTLWYGAGEESFNGLHFTYYDEKALESICQGLFSCTMLRYTEMDQDDSILLIGRKI